MPPVYKQRTNIVRLLLIGFLFYFPSIALSDDYWDNEETETSKSHSIILINDYLEDNHTRKVHTNCHIINSNQRIAFNINAEIELSILDGVSVQSICPKNEFEPSYYYLSPPTPYPYFPPFRKDQRFLISQSYKGNPKLSWLDEDKKSSAKVAYNKITTHSGKDTKYAVDLVMPVGTDICASREGVIISIQNNQKTGLWNQIVQKSNYVKIKHDDGSLALYGHLKHKSVSKSVGDPVKQGECFALSGNTGKSSGPHLHFAVLIPIEDEEVSIPFNFLDSTNKLIDPIYMEWLTW